MSRGLRPIVIAGGGTAGHILPGLAIADALISDGHGRDSLLWIGSSRGQEQALVGPTGIELVLLPGRGIQRRLTLANIGAVFGLLVAGLRAFVLVGRRRPAVVLTLGGYASVAASLAAVVWRVPIVVAEQNAVAGAANRVMGRWARACAVPFAGTGLAREVVTGNPVRDAILALRSETVDGIVPARAAAREQLGIEPGRRLVVSFAGSLGSRRINEALANCAETWVGATPIHVHHVIGRRDFATFRRPDPLADGVEYVPVEYEDRMDLLLAAADVVVSRAGGTTVAELAVVGIPSILGPLPIAPGDHQRANARALVDSGAARLVDDGDCTGERLVRELAEILDNPGRVEQMSAAAWAIGRPDAARAVAELVEESAGGHSVDGRAHV